MELAPPAACLTHVVKRYGAQVAPAAVTLLPMPHEMYLAAKMAMAMVFAAVVSFVLMASAAVVGGVLLVLLRLSVLFALAVLGVIPFWAPLSLLIRPLQQLAPLWPGWHLAQMAQVAVDAQARSGTAGQVLALAAVAATCFVAARAARSPDRARGSGNVRLSFWQIPAFLVKSRAPA